MAGSTCSWDGCEILTGDRGMLIRGALRESEQRALYLELCSAAQSTTELQLLLRVAASDQPASTPWPLVFWRHPYTGDSNVPVRPGALDWVCSLACGASGAVREEHSATLATRAELRRLCERLERLQPDSVLDAAAPAESLALGREWHHLAHR